MSTLFRCRYVGITLLANVQRCRRVISPWTSQLLCQLSYMNTRSQCIRRLTVIIMQMKLTTLNNTSTLLVSRSSRSRTRSWISWAIRQETIKNDMSHVTWLCYSHPFFFIIYFWMKVIHIHLDSAFLSLILRSRSFFTRDLVSEIGGRVSDDWAI